MYGKIEPEGNPNRFKGYLLLGVKVTAFVVGLGILFLLWTGFFQWVNQRWLHLPVLASLSLGQASILALALLLPAIDRGGFRNLGVLGTWKGYDAGVIIGIIGLHVVGSMVSVGLMMGTGTMPQEDSMKAIGVFSQFGALNAGSFLLTGFGLALQAGVGEELLFRGYVMTRLERLGLGAWPTIIISALLFGLVHMDGYGLLSSLSKAIWFGIPTGAYFWYRRNLGPLMAAHTLMDFMAFLLLFVMMKLTGGQIPTFPQ
ncbi:MAG TPA: CPBP family intramembrane glutamic endopeptidase [Symbiobacteriaceae bacterium]|nr:CPBP family intramembrane glutamic endopeptidase [Symbiobacteriaceae bacterium]